MSETAESCAKSIYEECRLHPVDCPNCVHCITCQMRVIVQGHRDKIKSCRHFRAR